MGDVFCSLRMGEVVDELLNDACVSPRIPTPIHFALPTMKLEDDAEDMALR